MSKQRRKIVWIAIGILIVFHPATFDALLAFLFAGIVPGTAFELPFWAMSLLLASIGYLAIRWATKEPVYIGDINAETNRKRVNARKYVMRKISPVKKPERRIFLRKRKRTYRVATS